MQLEIPIAAVQAAAKAAKTAGITVILDPAPVQTPNLSPIYPHIDWLLPNQVEAGQLVGFTVHDRVTAAQAATQLQAQGVPNVIVKLGEQGAWCQTPTESHFVPPFSVVAVDTVACGDAFAAGFSAALLANLTIPTALQWASAAGALAATKQGAQLAMPDRATLEAFLRSH
jgi:ribokinase